MLKGFAYHGVTVSNLDRSVAFYRDLMNMKLESTYEMAGEVLEEATGFPGAHIEVAILSSHGHLLKLTQYLSPEGRKNFEARVCDVGASHLAIRVDSVQEAYDELRAKGVKFMSPPVQPYPENPRIVFTYMLDPDGMVVELHLGSYDSGRIIGKYHHSYTVSDMDRAMAFYRDMLGLKVLRIGQPKGRGIEEGTGLSEVDFMLAHMGFDDDESIEFFYFVHPKGKQQQEFRLCDVGCSRVAFNVDNVQQAYEEFQSKGARFISRPVHPIAERPEITMVYMLDPDNYVVELRCGEALMG